MIRVLLEVYSDDLIISSSQTTAIGLSKVLENCCSFPATGSFPLMKSRRSLRNDGQAEEFYKSVNSNAAFAKSPASTVRTQSNHCFAAIYAFIKLEKQRIKTGLNHFAIKRQIYIEALKIAIGQA